MSPAMRRFAGAVAHAARVEGTHAVVHIVTDAIRIGIFGAVAATDANDVELIAVAVAVPLRDVLTTTCVSHQAVAHAALSKAPTQCPHRHRGHRHRRLLCSRRHTRPRRPAGCCRSRSCLPGCQTTAQTSPAHCTSHGVVGADAVVHVVTDVVLVDIGKAITAAHAEGVQLAAFAAAVASGMSLQPQA